MGAVSTDTDRDVSAPGAADTDLLDLARASEVRDPHGRRYYGSVDTLRRRIKDGSLPHTRHGTKYVVRKADLEQLRRANTSAKALADLKAAARRAAATAPPVSAEVMREIAAILQGRIA